MKVIVNIDGGSRGNPGPAGAGVIVRDAGGAVLCEQGLFIGHATNNVAEYRGLLAGLEAAALLGAAEVVVRSDSELLVRQMNGRYRVKNAGLLPLYEKAMAMAVKFARCSFVHVPREQNHDADRLANEAMDLKKDVSRQTHQAEPTPGPAKRAVSKRDQQEPLFGELNDDVPPFVRNAQPAGGHSGHTPARSPKHDTPAGQTAAAGQTLHLLVNVDGGSRGNPGPGGAGVVVSAEDETSLHEAGLFLGRCTNNVAEYRGLIAGLEAALKYGATDVTIRSDSELMVKQMNGIYRVKNEGLKPLHEQAKSAAAPFASVKYVHIPREQNAQADSLANLAMDKKHNVEEV